MKLLLAGALLAVGALAAFGASQAAAQAAFPSHPVKVIVPQPPGGGFDFVARLLADRMGKQAGQAADGKGADRRRHCQGTRRFG